ncbi:MAG: hypothetical protein ACFCUW_04825 [Kiloniellaceae bacterium]
MSILRDDRLLALHDLVEACRDSARHCALAAEMMEDDPRAGKLRDLAERRSREADFFGARMIEEDDIPGGAPEERSLLQAALAGARSVLVDSGWEALLDDCRSREQEVMDCAKAAREAPLRDDERKAAGELADDAGQQLETLFKY